MSHPPLDPHDIARLTRLAEILTPATEKMPGPGAIDDFEDLLQSAIIACCIPQEDLRAALAAMPPVVDWDTVQSFSAAAPAHFENLALVASGAYVMSSAVLGRLGFPEDRRNPAGPFEAADEYDTGILEPVVSRGPFFRDPRST